MEKFLRNKCQGNSKWFRYVRIPKNHFFNGIFAFDFKVVFDIYLTGYISTNFLHFVLRGFLEKLSFFMFQFTKLVISNILPKSVLNSNELTNCRTINIFET